MDNEKYYLARENMWAAARAVGIVTKKELAEFAGMPASRVSELKNDNAIRWRSLNKIITAIVESGRGDYTEEWFFTDHNKPANNEELITEVRQLKEIVLRMEKTIEELKK